MQVLPEDFWSVSNLYQKKKQLSDMSCQMVVPGSNMEKWSKKLLEWGFFYLSVIICQSSIHSPSKIVSEDV